MKIPINLKDTPLNEAQADLRAHQGHHIVFIVRKFIASIWKLKYIYLYFSSNEGYHRHHCECTQRNEILSEFDQYNILR